jgi:hypothetical protein
MAHAGGQHKRAPGIVGRAHRFVTERGYHVAALDAHLHTAELTSPEATAELVGELSTASGELAALWRRHEVWVKRGDETAFRHPLIGHATLANEVLHDAGDGQRMLIYQAPPGTAEHDALILLAMAAHNIGAS